MPGTIVNALLTKFQKDFDMPTLKVAYDGLMQSTESIRVEAFMYQCRERFEARLRKSGNGAAADRSAALAAMRSAP